MMKNRPSRRLLLFSLAALTVSVMLSMYAYLPVFAEDGEPPIEEGLMELREAMTPHVDSIAVCSGSDLIDEVEDEIVISGSDELPKSFSLLDSGRVTGAKNQGYTSTCWAFGALSSAESGLLTKGMAGSDIDLSELHLAYYTYNAPASIPVGIENDKTALRRNNYITVGGSDWLTLCRLACRIGAVDEGVNTKWRLLAESTEQENANFPAQCAYDENDYVLRNCDIISLRDTDQIKALIMEKGACSLTMTYYNQFYSVNRDGRACYYQNAYSCEDTNHIVSIVGWDDDFSADNFAIKPPRDGAWLAKNSYSEHFGENGFFWISYADRALLGRSVSGEVTYNDVYFYDMVPAEEGSDLYQYDGGASLKYLRSTSKTASEAAIFTSDGDKDGKLDRECLTEVSFYTVQPVVSYSIQVYTDIENGSDPTSGAPALSEPVTGVLPYSGFHTVSLGENIVLREGQRFSVVINLESAGSNLILPLDCDETWSWVSFDTASAAGQTFYSVNGITWTDASKRVAGGCSMRVKAGTAPFVPTYAESLTLSAHEAECDAGETVSLSAEVLPAEHTEELEWTWTAETSASDAAITPDGRYGADFVPSLPGRYTVTAGCDSVSDSCVVTVYRPARELYVSESDITIEVGKPYDIRAAVLPLDNTDGLEITYASSDTEVVSVSDAGVLNAASGAEGQKAEITVTAGKFEKKISVTVRKPVTSLFLNRSAATVSEGDAIELKAIVKPEDTTDRLTWTSSSPAARVDENGRVVCEAPGTAEITLSAGGKTAKCTVESVPDISLTAMGGSVRVIEPFGLRFGIKLEKNEAYSKHIREIKEYGTLIIPAKNLGSAELTVNTEKAQKAKAVNIYSEDENGITFTCVLVGIPKASFNSDIVGRGYLVYTDINGAEKVLYTDVIVRSFEQVAQSAYKRYAANENRSAADEKIFENLELIISQNTDK